MVESRNLVSSDMNSKLGYNDSLSKWGHKGFDKAYERCRANKGPISSLPFHILLESGTKAMYCRGPL